MKPRPHSGVWTEAALEGAFGLAGQIRARWHLRRCPTCREQLDADRQLGQQLRAALPPAPLPSYLERRIKRLLDAEAPPPAWTVPPPRPRLLPLAGSGFAGLAAGVVLILVMQGGGSVPGAPQHSLIDSHIRSLMGDHLTDVGSTDQHAVKPWLSARLALSPPVAEIPGYSLVGGRLDYIDGHEAASVVYRRRQHVINLFAWPSALPGSGPAGFGDRGFNVLTWRRDGLELAAVSDLNMPELREFVQQVSPKP